MALSNAEKSRRWRERKRVEQEARDRYDRGLPAKVPEPEAPEGAYLTANGFARPKYDHYEAKDGSFPAIPRDILEMTFTTPDGIEDIISGQHARFLARQREAPIDASRDALFEE